MANGGIDLRNMGYLGPVRDQGDGSNCYLFPPISAMEFLYHQVTGVELPLSVQDPFDYLVLNEEQKNKGYNYMQVFTWFMVHGCVSEASWPYRGGAYGPPRPEESREVLFRITDYELILLEDMKEKLVNGPIVVPLPWILEMDQFTGDGIYNGPASPDAFIPSPTNPVMRHAVLVAGYDSVVVDEIETEYWIIKNSHGMGWGQDGYGKFNMSIMYGDSPLIFGGFAPREISFTDIHGRPYNANA